MRRACLLSLLMTWMALSAGAARAAQYEADVRIDGEQALLALYEDGTLSRETFETLLELYRTGVDLGTATREALHALPGLTYAQVDALLAYREREGGVEEPEALVAAGILTGEQLRGVRPFLAGAEREAWPVTGRLRLLTAYASADALTPPVLLQSRLEGPAGLRGGGVLTLTRRRLGPVRYDARRGALMAEAPGLAPHLPKLHVQWVGAHAAVLVGTYRLGFGQRLTLDITQRAAPEGFTPDEGFVAPGSPERRCPLTGDEASCASFGGQGEVTPDFGWTEGFRGVAGTVRGRVGETTLSLTGFGSYQARGVSPSELFDRTACEDPRASRKECQAPQVLLAGAGPRAPRLTARTLPDVFHELAGGGNVGVAFSPRARVGLTAWGARPVWTVEGVALDFQEHARYPEGGGFGAVGVDAAWGAGPVDFFIEGARSFDGIPGRGGGFGVVQRTAMGSRHQALELALRYYGRDFANPYSRATSSPDEFEGLRARNEMGARVQAFHRLDAAWRLRGQVEAWTQPPGGETPGAVQLRASARVDHVGLRGFQPSVWVEHHDKGLAWSEDGQCSGRSARRTGAPSSCAGERYRVAGRVRLGLAEGLNVAAQYQHTLVEEPRAEELRQQGSAVLDVLYRPLPSLRVQGRVSWRAEDLFEEARPGQALRASLDVSWAGMSALSTHARYELALEPLASSEAPPLPEPPHHLFRLELEARF